MTEDTSVEAQRIRSGKVTRVRIRLKDPLPAGQEIHTVLPNSLAELEEALKRRGTEELRARLAAVDERM